MLRHEFSWSMTRHRIFERCHRAYYYQYYASWGGWERLAEKKTKLLYHLKKLQTIQSWTESVFRKTLTTGIADGEVKSKHLLRLAKSQIRREAFDIKNNESAEDSKITLLSEIYYENSTINELQEEAEKYIEVLVARFAESQAFEIISNIDPLAIKSIPQPASFLLNGIKIWTNPDLIWTNKGKIKILNIIFKDPMKSYHWAEKATLDKMFTEDLFPGNKKVETSSFFLHEDNFPEITISRNKKEVQSIIDKSCQEMLELTNLDTNIKEEVFKRTDGDACKHCNFKQVCY